MRDKTAKSVDFCSHGGKRNRVEHGVWPENWRFLRPFSPDGTLPIDASFGDGIVEPVLRPRRDSSARTISDHGGHRPPWIPRSEQD